MNAATLVIIAAVVLLAACFVRLYNRFVSLKNRREEAWSGIFVQLKRRHDLVPNLVETVGGYARHEKETLAQVTRMRGAALGDSPQQAARLEGAFSQMLGRLLALSESYPELKADSQFLALQQSLNDIENNLQMARRYYNGVVRDYNTLVDSFPSLIIARLFSFQTAGFFDLDDASEANMPKVQF